MFGLFLLDVCFRQSLAMEHDRRTDKLKKIKNSEPVVHVKSMRPPGCAPCLVVHVLHARHNSEPGV